MFDRTGTAPEEESTSARRFSGPLAFRTTERQSNRPFHLAVDNMPNAMLVIGGSGEILASNRAADGFFLHGSGQLTGRQIDDLLPDLSIALDGESWSRFCDRPQTRTLGGDRPLTAVRSDGAVVPIEIRLKTVVDGAIPHIFASLTDVTERVKQEARQEAAAAAQLHLQPRDRGSRRPARDGGRRRARRDDRRRPGEGRRCPEAGPGHSLAEAALMTRCRRRTRGRGCRSRRARFSRCRRSC